MGAGPATGRNRRVSFSRALLPCLALAVLFPAFAAAQTLTPDMFSDLVSVEQQLWRPQNVHCLGVLPEPYLSQVLRRFS